MARGLYFGIYSEVPFSRTDYWTVAKKLGWERVSSAFIGERGGKEMKRKELKGEELRGEEKRGEERRGEEREGEERRGI